jgi:putative sigma-54 modulation protein
MRVEVTGKNGFNPWNDVKEYAEKKLTKLQDLLPDYDTTSARVVCKNYSSYQKVEVTIPSKNIILRAEVDKDDLYQALDAAIDKLVAQIKKYNSKLKEKIGKESLKYREVDSEPIGEVVRDKHLKLEPLSREEAVDQMELLGHKFFVYLDKETRKTTVLYQRDDGNYAVIITE